MFRKIFNVAIGLTMAVSLVGCGGGSAGGAGISVTGGGASDMFLTASSTSSYDHIWVTVTGVNLVSSTGNTATVYDGTSTGGQVVDLRSLSVSGNQQFLLLTGFNAPSGTFKGANITVNSALSVVPAGSSAATSATFAGSKGGSAVLTATFSSPQSVGASGGVALNFNLANWKLSGSTMTALNNQFMQINSTAGVNITSNVASGNYFGTVSALAGAAPTQTFTITRGRFSVNVETSASTVLYNSDGSANPVLATGQAVDVAGTYDSTSNAINATAIIIQVGLPTPPQARVVGIVSSDSQTANTITIQINGCGGFMPLSTALTLDVNSSTTFIDSSGVTDTEAQFYGNLTPGTSTVQVEGTISGSVLTATTIQILPAPGTGGSNLVALRGSVSNISTSADTFTLTVKQWEGHWQFGTQTVSVVTTPDTQFAVDGTVESAVTFFASLPVASTVNVRGTLDSSTQTLTAAIITQGQGNGGGFHF